MSALETTGTTLFIVLLFFGVYCVIFGLPGTLVILIDVISYAAVTHFATIGLPLIGLLTIMTLVVEGIDVLSGIAGARMIPASKTSVVVSLVGGVLGAAALTPVFLGLGTITGLFLGGFGGMLLVEQAERKKLKPLFRERFGIRAGRLGIVLLKGATGIAMSVLVVTRIYS